ncbi:hypothetical protein [Acinetobacter phage Ab69]|nr:hypothetical protein [Acinetobacter phage Ab69]
MYSKMIKKITKPKKNLVRIELYLDGQISSLYRKDA